MKNENMNEEINSCRVHIEHVANDLRRGPLFVGGGHGQLMLVIFSSFFMHHCTKINFTQIGCQTFLSHMYFNNFFKIPYAPAKKTQKQIMVPSLKYWRVIGSLYCDPRWMITHIVEFVLRPKVDDHTHCWVCTATQGGWSHTLLSLCLAHSKEIKGKCETI